MSALSAEKLADYLHEYSVYLEYWSPDEGDSHEMLGAREILGKNAGRLTSADAEELARLDRKAIRLMQTYRGRDTWDVKMLRETARLAHEHLTSREASAA